MRDLIERLKWRIAVLVDDYGRRQCWADLVSWVLNDEPIRDKGLRSAMPWRPITPSCFRDARSAGRCYCGSVGSDGTVLGRGETVCPSPMPGRPTDRMCSRPNGHDGAHQCGGVEWGRS